VSERTDQELLLAWRAGDRDAGSELITRHTGSLHGFLVNKVQAPDIAEVVSATLENCVRSIDNFRGESTFRTFLFSVARNTVLNFYRKRRRSPKIAEAELGSIVEMGAGPTTMIAAHEEQRLLIEGLRRLPIDDQILLELYYMEEMSAAEIAVVYETVEPTIRGRIHRAKGRLAQIVSAISTDPAALTRTLTDLEGWARSIRSRRDTKPGG